MKFKIYKTSDWGYEREVEINSLEDLKNLEERFIQTSKKSFTPTHDIIVNFDNGEIIVYDYYIE